MRKELIHFLQQTTDKATMLAFLKNLDMNHLITLFHYLDFTDTTTTDRWLDAYLEIAY